MHHLRLHSVVLAVVLMALSTATALAQDTAATTEADFWQQMAVSQAQLESAVLADQNQRAAILETVRNQWTDATTVQLETGEVIPVNTAWLRLPPNTDGATIQETVRRIEVLRSYDGQPGIAIASAPSPPPQQEPPRRELRLPPWLDDMFRITLVIMGIILVAAVLFFIASGLRLTTALAGNKTNPEVDEDPQTSDDARNRAKSSEKSQDYRTAVRYLYLAALLRLDEAGLIRYDPTLTNQEHLSQIDDHPNLKDILTPIINFFDRTWYGFATISDEDYQDFRNLVDRLNSMAAKRTS